MKVSKLVWSRAGLGVVFLVVLGVFLVSGDLRLALANPGAWAERWEGVLVELHGALADILLFGVLISAYDVYREHAQRDQDQKRALEQREQDEERERQRRIDEWNAQLSDFQGWNSEESARRTAGVMRRLVGAGEPVHARKANLQGADLSHSNLEGAVLFKAVLFKASLEETNLARANLEGTNLTRANLMGSDLRGANLTGASLKGALLLGSVLSGADLSGADLSGANLSGADLSGADLRGANLTKANLRGANLSKADFVGAIPRFHTGLSWEDVVDIYNSGANPFMPCALAKLEGADLSGANLKGAFLAGIDFGQVDLGGVSLDEAHLEDTNFYDAALMGPPPQQSS